MFANSLTIIWTLLVTSVWTSTAAHPVIELTSESISKVHTGLWLVKVFYAPWCSFCRQLEPVYQEAALTLSRILPEVHVARIDVPANPTVSTDFSIRGYPTIIL
ncbi:unnamed protein product [Dibothriocephalus latus]|uniref:Thioredoxin domain-containing protein n=1 Tax=Dibothriocephalus latus TaxID=60516 RepID=A0A3P7LWQ9_DIBLA|nr:unnamed protein product [Dibothriocephalus latus]